MRFEFVKHGINYNSSKKQNNAHLMYENSLPTKARQIVLRGRFKINKSESHYRSERNQDFARSGNLQITSIRKRVKDSE